jgi:long-chain acyl-CoA synthetase
MLTTRLQRAVQADPGKTAIVQGCRRVRYDELAALVGRCAGGLRRLGIGIGDCVAVMLPNSPEFVTCLFACARLRAVMLPLNPQFTKEELTRLVVDARAKVVITDPSRAGVFVGTDAPIVDFESLQVHPADPMPAGQFGGRALFLFTSGTTNTCKRLCCTQENLHYEAHNFVETVGLTAADNILCSIPLHHSYGIGNCLLDAAYAGSTLVLFEPSDIPFAARCPRVLELIRTEGIRFFPGVPYQFHILAALPEQSEVDLAGLRLCVSSGDVLPRQTYERFLKRFGLPIRSLYGSTEAGSISINLDPADTPQFGSLGSPLKNVTIRIRDRDGRDLPANERGEIWVKSPVIPQTGYENQPELTAKAFRGGFYNTGDIGMLDERGRLVMTGRKQTFITVGGHKVDLGEVEDVLQNHAHVQEAAVLGVDVAHLGTILKAVVVTNGTCSTADILSHCRERLALFKVPRLIEYRPALPRSSIGKVLKSELGDVSAYLAGVDEAEFARAWRHVFKEGRTQQTEFLVATIRKQAALSLQCELEAISHTASFESMGCDSLRAAELHQRLIMLTGLPLSITILWSYPNLDALADALLDRLNGNANETAPEEVATAPVDSGMGDFDELLAEVAVISNSDVDALFRAK